jgi:hypothetical protein
MSEPVITAVFTGKTAVVLCAVASLACADITRRIHHKPTHLLFAAILGTALSAGLIRCSDIFLSGNAGDNPFAAAAAVVLTVIGWRLLFGPWEVQTKLTLLGTFLFWISLHLLRGSSGEDLAVRLVAAGTALLPAVIWCWLFLKYHRERLSSVLLLFCAGMLSTVPILFYDSLVRRGVELQFFLFRIRPESFNEVSQDFVSAYMSGSGMSLTIFTALLSFVFVGLIEEISKYWVLSRSGRQMFHSIDDVMQLSIMAAIGFAFAENIVNPVYFTSFVRQYLFHAASPDIGGFLGNVMGRSVLTSMVHILATGVMGYFLGLAIFASPVLAEMHASKRVGVFLATIHRLLRLPEVSVFRVQMLTTGLLCAVTLHGLFNFLVTLPDILPGNPQSVADLLGSGAPHFLGNIPLLLVPALLYVVGGFWLLTTLFMRKQNMVERGHLVTKEELVTAE